MRLSNNKNLSCNVCPFCQKNALITLVIQAQLLLVEACRLSARHENTMSNAERFLEC